MEVKKFCLAEISPLMMYMPLVREWLQKLLKKLESNG